jgi:hypothetical protein
MPDKERVSLLLPFLLQQLTLITINIYCFRFSTGGGKTPILSQNVLISSGTLYCNDYLCTTICNTNNGKV